MELKMKDDLRISKELIQYLEKTILLNPSDLKLKDYDRGVKAGQLEILAKLKVLLEQQERRY
jgi:hypothetical protein